MIKAELDSNLKAFENFKSVWAERLQNTAGSQRKKLEAIFLKEKTRKESAISELRQRYWAVASYPGREGLTEPGSIVSQVFSISNDIRDVLVKLRNRYKAEAVIDVSSLLPPAPEKYNVELVQSNAMAVLFAGRKI